MIPLLLLQYRSRYGFNTITLTLCTWYDNSEVYCNDIIDYKLVQYVKVFVLLFPHFMSWHGVPTDKM